MPQTRRLRDVQLVVMDMDSTLITIECIDEIADMQGIKSEVAAITASAMRGEIEFAESLRKRVALLDGLPIEALDRVYRERLRLSPGALRMISGLSGGRREDGTRLRRIHVLHATAERASARSTLRCPIPLPWRPAS